MEIIFLYSTVLFLELDKQLWFLNCKSVECSLKVIADIRKHLHFCCCVPLTAMKGEHLFANMRSAPFLQRVYLLGGEELVVLQSTMGESSLGDSFQQITDFNDLPTSLFACNVDQSVFEDHEGKVRLNLNYSHIVPSQRHFI